MRRLRSEFRARRDLGFTGLLRPTAESRVRSLAESLDDVIEATRGLAAVDPESWGSVALVASDPFVEAMQGALHFTGSPWPPRARRYFLAVVAVQEDSAADEILERCTERGSITALVAHLSGLVGEPLLRLMRATIANATAADQDSLESFVLNSLLSPDCGVFGRSWDDEDPPDVMSVWWSSSGDFLSRVCRASAEWAVGNLRGMKGLAALCLCSAGINYVLLVRHGGTGGAAAAIEEVGLLARSLVGQMQGSAWGSMDTRIHSQLNPEAVTRFSACLRGERQPPINVMNTVSSLAVVGLCDSPGQHVDWAISLLLSRAGVYWPAREQPPTNTRSVLLAIQLLLSEASGHDFPGGPVALREVASDIVHLCFADCTFKGDSRGSAAAAAVKDARATATGLPQLAELIQEAMAIPELFRASCLGMCYGIERATLAVAGGIISMDSPESSPELAGKLVVLETPRQVAFASWTVSQALSDCWMVTNAKGENVEIRPWLEEPGLRDTEEILASATQSAQFRRILFVVLLAATTVLSYFTGEPDCYTVYSLISVVHLNELFTFKRPGRLAHSVGAKNLSIVLAAAFTASTAGWTVAWEPPTNLNIILAAVGAFWVVAALVCLLTVTRGGSDFPEEGLSSLGRNSARKAAIQQTGVGYCYGILDTQFGRVRKNLSSSVTVEGTLRVGHENGTSTEASGGI